MSDLSGKAELAEARKLSRRSAALLERALALQKRAAALGQKHEQQ